MVAGVADDGDWRDGDDAVVASAIAEAGDEDADPAESWCGRCSCCHRCSFSVEELPFMASPSVGCTNGTMLRNQHRDSLVPSQAILLASSGRVGLKYVFIYFYSFFYNIKTYNNYTSSIVKYYFIYTFLHLSI